MTHLTSRIKMKLEQKQSAFMYVVGKQQSKYETTGDALNYVIWKEIRGFRTFQFTIEISKKHVFFGVLPQNIHSQN